MEGFDEVEDDDRYLEEDVNQLSRYSQPRVSVEAVAHLKINRIFRLIYYWNSNAGHSGNYFRITSHMIFLYFTYTFRSFPMKKTI